MNILNGKWIRNLDSSALQYPFSSLLGSEGAKSYWIHVLCWWIGFNISAGRHGRCGSFHASTWFWHARIENPLSRKVEVPPGPAWATSFKGILSRGPGDSIAQSGWVWHLPRTSEDDQTFADRYLRPTLDESDGQNGRPLRPCYRKCSVQWLECLGLYQGSFFHITLPGGLNSHSEGCVVSQEWTESGTRTVQWFPVGWFGKLPDKASPEGDHAGAWASLWSKAAETCCLPRSDHRIRGVDATEAVACLPPSWSCLVNAFSSAASLSWFPWLCNPMSRWSSSQFAKIRAKYPVWSPALFLTSPIVLTAQCPAAARGRSSPSVLTRRVPLGLGSLHPRSCFSSEAPSAVRTQIPLWAPCPVLPSQLWPPSPQHLSYTLLVCVSTVLASLSAASVVPRRVLLDSSPQHRAYSVLNVQCLSFGRRTMPSV